MSSFTPTIYRAINVTPMCDTLPTLIAEGVEIQRLETFSILHTKNRCALLIRMNVKRSYFLLLILMIFFLRKIYLKIQAK